MLFGLTKSKDMVQKFGVVDLGSNSVKILIAQKAKNSVAPEDFKVLTEKSWVTRLGRGIKKQGDLLDPESLKLTQKAISEMKTLISEHSIETQNLKALGTAALRRCGNPEKVADLVKNHLQIPLKIISGEEEAKLSFSGAMVSAFSVWGTDSPLIFCEIGGASSQLSTSVSPDSAFSIPVGAVRVFETKEPALKLLQENNWKNIREQIEKTLNPKNEIPRKMVAVGGSLVLAAKLCPNAKAQNKIPSSPSYLLNPEDFFEYSNYISGLSLEERKGISGMDPQRADILPAALEILNIFLKEFEIQKLLVTSFGLRHGALAKPF